MATGFSSTRLALEALPPIMVFDERVAELAALCDLRAAFDVRSGACTMLERLALLGTPVAGVWVHEALAGITRERHPGMLVNTSPEGASDVLLLNGRWCGATGDALNEALRSGLAVTSDGEVLAGRVSAGELADLRPALMSGGPLGALAARGGPRVTIPATLLARPWHVRTFRDACLDLDLSLLLDRAGSGPGHGDHAAPGGSIAFGSHALHIAGSAQVYPGVVFDSEAGPIYIDEHAVIRPACTLIGPVYIGAHTRVLDRAIIKGHTAIGAWCKVAGEVGGTIFQGFTNKAHDGHLGDSWVGEWANLGAGTTNSNLLNTYAEVTARALPSSKTERSGHQFLGAMVGDHVKTAIGTRLMTGVVVHTGAMLAGSAAVSGCVPRFAWVTDRAAGEASVDAGAAPRRFRPDKFMEIARTVMARRKVALSDDYARVLGALLAGEARGGGA